MAEGNGEISLEEAAIKEEDVERTPDYRKLIEYGLDSKVASKLDEIYKTGKLAHAELDERALDALKEFPSDGALSVLGQFLDSNLEHVSNKSAYLCGVMKTYRQKSRAGMPGVPTASPVLPVKGPDEEKIKLILNRTGYALDVTTGQRKYGGPPPGWEGGTPGTGCEVFCGKIPKDMYEDELIPLFERCGTIWDLRLMMDPMTGANRGYAFVTFTTRDATENAVRELDNHEIKPGKTLKIKVSVPNLRLFVGNIPKSKGKEEILDEFGKLTAGLMEVIIYSSPDDKKKNRGFCFLEYESHKAASLAKRRLGTGRIKVWGCDIIVDWADPQEEPDEVTMSKPDNVVYEGDEAARVSADLRKQCGRKQQHPPSFAEHVALQKHVFSSLGFLQQALHRGLSVIPSVKVLYVRNLTQDTTEETLKETFENFGTVERVKKIKDYAFVHFEDRDCAVRAMRDLDGKELAGARLEVSLAKPPSDKKKKEEILRARERRMMQMIHGRGGYECSPAHGGIVGGGMRGRAPSASHGRGTPCSRGDYDYDYDYYGYGDYRGGYNEPYYRYDEFYFDYAAPPQPSAVRPASNRAQPDEELGLGSNSLYYDMAGGIQGGGSCTTGGRWGRRGGAAGAGRGGTRGVGARAARGRPTPSAMRGNPRAKPSLPGKRKYDGGHQNQGGDTKRRMGGGRGADWETEPLAQQPLADNGTSWS